MGLSKQQSFFLNRLHEGDNIFLTGRAGTGKTFIVKEAIRQLMLAGKKMVALAPSGIAASNVQGQTIHSMFSLDAFGILTFETCKYLNKDKKQLLKKIDVIFIDEVSMLRPDVLDAINWTLIKNGCGSLLDKQVVFIGDMKQLPAVVNDDIRAEFFRTYKDEEFTSAAVYSELRPREIELDVILRQSDEEFISNLNVVREGGKSKYFNRFVGTSARGIVLAPHNATVARYNMDGLNAIDKEPHVFEAIVTGTAKISDFSLEEKVVLKDGCRVMYLVNSPANKLVNGSLGVFKILGDEFFIVVGKKSYLLEKVELTKKEYAYNSYEDKLELLVVGSVVQYPVKLAYALTIHKSQGLSFDEVTVDLSRPCFSRGQLYVALSRVKSPEGLTIVMGDRVVKKKEPLDPDLEELLKLARQHGYGESWAYEIWNEQREYDYESELYRNRSA